MSADSNSDRIAFLTRQFNRHILDGIPRLRKLNYNPFEFLEMVERYGGAVGATKHLLADPRHTSYGFQRLYELKRLEDSVEFATCLPWFNELFTPAELEEAETRLIAHEFPLKSRLSAAAESPPAWLQEL
jgi:5-methylcytosine-specific restriction protein A